MSFFDLWKLQLVRVRPTRIYNDFKKLQALFRLCTMLGRAPNRHCAVARLSPLKSDGFTLEQIVGAGLLLRNAGQGDVTFPLIDTYVKFQIVPKLH